MKPIEIREIVSGTFVVALIALSIGKFSELTTLARKEAGRPLHNLTTFFPANYKHLHRK